MNQENKLKVNNFTQLGFYINHLLDEGKFLNMEDVAIHTERGDILTYLDLEFPGEFNSKNLANPEELEKAFIEISTIDPKELIVSKNGLAFLMALCLEYAQRA